jgi:hypothetical protein
VSFAAIFLCVASQRLFIIVVVIIIIVVVVVYFVIDSVRKLLADEMGGVCCIYLWTREMNAEFLSGVRLATRLNPGVINVRASDSRGGSRDEISQPKAIFEF